MEQRWQELLGRTTGSARGIANLAHLAGSVGNMYQQIFMLAILCMELIWLWQGS